MSSGFKMRFWSGIACRKINQYEVIDFAITSRKRFVVKSISTSASNTLTAYIRQFDWIVHLHQYQYCGLVKEPENALCLLTFKK